ncbi:MAG: hypothetical protein M1818_005816 [Claussenomyces sp. TS43310]|nr:MAG: hypothetical protein M1818_005816 [Claussenomyces sp. TS43310]
MSMLGGPPPASRESTAPPPSQYPAPSPAMTPAAPSTAYGTGSIQASPRMQPAGGDLDRFRRPQTPDSQRMHDTQRVRDSRAHSAGSPPSAATISTPETHRYSTPQAYQQRNTQGQSLGMEERREHYPVRVPNPNSAIPPRPSSQPTVYSGPTSRPAEAAMLAAEHLPRTESVYARPLNYGERDDYQAHRERQRLEDEAALRRERERREATNFSGQAQVVGHNDALYGLARETAESAYARPSPTYSGYQGAWGRRQDQPTQEQTPPQQQATPNTSNYDYSRPPVQSGSSRSVDGYAVQEGRYQPASYNPPVPAQPATAQTAPYEGAMQERHIPSAPQQAQQQVYHGGQSSSISNTYRLQDSPRRPGEEVHQPRQNAYLGVQLEMNRKGRTSPLPQAVQGAQGQISGPGSEPGIKNEFGKMFSGIGSGVGSMATPSVPNGPTQTSFINHGVLRREEPVDSVHPLESVMENGGHKISRTPPRGGGSGSRSRKLKEEDSKLTDDSSSGRRTPSGRAKRPRTVHHPAGGTHRHGLIHNHRYDALDSVTSPSQPDAVPFKISAAPQVQQSPPSVEQKLPVPHHHHINRHHHHHHHVAHPKPVSVPIPKPKLIIRSQAVLDSVAHLPREHLGHMVYEAQIDAEDSIHDTPRGFVSSAAPLPRFEGKENCTFTIRVPRVHLTPTSREELTFRRAVWGTDVYTDDSDVIAACIHGGWIRGEWPKDIDASLLGLEIDDTPPPSKSNGVRKVKMENGASGPNDKSTILSEPPARGPITPPSDRDLHITILILPALEKYSSTVRFGIKSRDWGGSHDGISYMIQRIKWVSGVDTAKESKGMARRMRMRASLADDEMAEEQAWGGLLERGNGFADGRGFLVQESFERGGPGPLSELKGLGEGGWWRGRRSLGKGGMGRQVETEAGPAIENHAVGDEQSNGRERQPSDAMIVS